MTLTVDHQLRGQESLDDVKFVQNECARLGIPCKIGRVDVSGYKKDQQVGTQVAAREKRYQFLLTV
nr:ATP-binding protein [Piscibacillus salipiscarius]